MEEYRRPASKTTIICDIDGTIANLQHRLHYIKNSDGTKKKKPDWDSFHKAAIDDEPYRDVLEVVLDLFLGMQLVHEGVHRQLPKNMKPPSPQLLFFSGRNESVRAETEQWLSNISGHFEAPNLYMRSADDRRPDMVVKLEMMNSLGLTPDDVLCIFDDRQSVVDMWRANGFRVMQVDAWKEDGRWQDELRARLEEASKHLDKNLWREEVDPKDVH